jgi:hypothetical protein
MSPRLLFSEDDVSIEDRRKKRVHGFYKPTQDLKPGASS